MSFLTATSRCSISACTWIFPSKLRASNRIKENKAGLFISLIACCWGNMWENYGTLGPIENHRSRCCQWHPLTFEKQHVADDDRQGLRVSRCSWDSLSIILSFTATEFCRFQVFILWFFTVKFGILLSMLSKFLKPVQYRLYPSHYYSKIDSCMNWRLPENPPLNIY